MAVRGNWVPNEVLKADDLNDTFASKLDLAGGKILQIVRATDATARSTTNAGIVDASLSVTITPQKSDSAIILIWSALVYLSRGSSGSGFGTLQITDNSNNALSGASRASFQGNSLIELRAPLAVVGYSTPATTSATTYKARFGEATASTTVTLLNDENLGTLYAIEVSA